jgi:sulfite reductase (NADPH) hemoprotein beta-component
MTNSINTVFSTDGDVREFSAGLDDYVSGRWFADRWKTFRLRFGIYEQRQPGQHMIRAKVPGGRLTFDQARAIATANANNAGGDIHVTTRQGVQFYFVPQTNLAGLLSDLHDGGVTTREASGATFRAIVACPHAGVCGEQLTDAATVAGQLTEAWLRHPLTQHMPRKFKTSVSGCTKDCGLGGIDDLAFIAVEKNGEKGFRVLAGGGLGIAPAHAIEVFDFVAGHDLPRVQEAIARLHQEQSSRTNKNRARIKFLVKRFGAANFVARVHEAFNALEGLDGPAWKALDWSGYKAEGRKSVEIEIPLGWLTSAQFEGLANLAEQAGGSELRLTRTQNIIAQNLPERAVADFVNGVRELGLDASGRVHALAKLVSCPGSSTCSIGITDSHALAGGLLAAGGEFVGLPEVTLRVSGCHNSCGHHHIADIGFHGLAKKIDGNPTPHYQLHLGGSPDTHGILGPVIPAHRVKDALRLLLKALKEEQLKGESVRTLAERLGDEAIAKIVQPSLEGLDKDADKLRFDIGSDVAFVPPATATGECAAAAVVAEHLADLARVARLDAARAARANRQAEVLLHLGQALDAPLQRLLVIGGETSADSLSDREAAVRSLWSHDASLLAALDDAVRAVKTGEVDLALPALATWQVAADFEVERILTAVPGYLSQKLNNETFAGAAQ